MDYSFLLGSLESVLGKSHKRARDNYAFNCPVCNHKKPKLEVNLKTNDKGHNPWECWVCGKEGTRGMTIFSLLKKIRVPKSEAVEILKYVKKGEKYNYKIEDTVTLPEDFTPLYQATDSSVIANRYKKYLYGRGLTDNDFIKYNIGYCRTGEYEGRIILPSYSSSNRINFFTARAIGDAYNKYMNPEANKDIIFFENLINWDKPLILCEGVFDAIAIKRNAIPILGKGISDRLKLKIIQSEIQDIYVALDGDALNVAIGYCEEFIKLGINVYLVELGDKDPSDIGFENFTKLVQTANKLEFSDLMRYKIEMI